MSATTYRFVGELAEVFPDLTGERIAVAQPDPDQVPGELRPGQEFTGPGELAHVRIERADAGGWVPTVRAETADEPVTDETPTQPAPRGHRRAHVGPAGQEA